MGTISYTLREGFNRLTTQVRELDDSIVLEAGKVFHTDHPAVQAALESHDAVERVEAADQAPASDAADTGAK